MRQEPAISPQDLISAYLRLLRRNLAAPEISALPLSARLPAPDPSRSCVLLLSPHPDDECLTGALPLRLKREGWRVMNVAVTLGSDQARREARKAELAKACAVLGFECVLADEECFSAVTAEARAADPAGWRTKAARIAEIITHVNPQAVVLPHAQDAHPSHIGTHLLGMDALAKQEAGFSCAVVQTEYWQPIAEPNLMIGVDESDAGALLSALACHADENARNPYDVRFPAWLIDNVRRGSEGVGGKGVAAAPFDFAMLYCYGIWKNGRFMASSLNRVIGDDQKIGELFLSDEG